MKKEPNNIYRKKLWMISSGAKKEMKEHPNYYNNILTNYPEEMSNIHHEIILKDLPRTFPDKKDEELYYKKLENILIAYSRRNPFLGYCQGFNFIVYFILKIIKKEEEAFWLFVQIIEKILPLNYYSNVLGVLVYSALIEQLLFQFLPELFSFIQKNDYEIHITNLLYKWLLSLFIENFPEKLSLIIWDALFLNGDIILFKASLGVLRNLKPQIMKVNSIKELNSLFEQKIQELQDPTVMIYFLLLRKFDFDVKQLYLIRRDVENQLQNSVIEKIKSHSPKKTNKRINDNEIYNSEEIQNFLVLQYIDPLEIIDNYCDNVDNYQNNSYQRLSIKSKNEIWNELLVNRYCFDSEDNENISCKSKKIINLKSIFIKVKTSKCFLSLLNSFNK